MKWIVLAAPLFLLTGCLEDEAEQRQKNATQASLNEADRQIGMPAIVNFQERRMAKELLERRDQKIATHSYIYNQMQGCLVYLGPSIGYGLPYSTQFTNPQKVHNLVYGIILPQAEPNGLYMPEASHATWVMLYNPEKKEMEPVYIEPDVLVSTFRLTNRECK